MSFSSSNSVEGLAASVSFITFGRNDLAVVLSDTYTGGTPSQNDVLTGVFFSGAAQLKPVLATASLGSLEWMGTRASAPSANLGGEWAFATGPGAPGGASSGIVSTAYWIPTQGNFGLFGDNEPLDGTGYGLVSAGYRGGLGDEPYIQGSMIFIFSGFCGNVQNISDVSFEYGTNPNPVQLPVGVTVVPEPSVTAEIAVAGAVVAGMCWKRRKASNAPNSSRVTQTGKAPCEM